MSSSGDTHTLDLRGEVCPYTFVYARLRLEELPIGAALEILVDHEPATRNVPRSIREWGQVVETVEPAETLAGVWRIVVRKQVA